MATPLSSTVTTNTPKFLAAVCLFAGVFSLFVNWLFWARFHIDIPVEDSLKLLPTIQSFVDNGWRGVSLEEWISPHAGAHRIAVGRLLQAVEYRYLGGGNTLMYLGSWLSIGVLCFLYFNISRLAKPTSTDLSVFMLGLALIFTCSYTQTSNLIIPITALWYIGAACSAFSIYLLVFPGENLSLLRASGACLFAVIASFCVFSGVITCLLIAVLVIQHRSKHALWLPVLMLAFVLLYLQGVTSGEELVLERVTGAPADVSLWTHIEALFEGREKLFHHTVTFLSAPLSKSPTPLSYVYVLSSCLLILYGWVTLARQWVAGTTRSGLEATTFYLAMATLFLGTAIACYLGRGFFSSPTAPRYQTTVMLYWLSIGGLLLHSLPGKQDARARAVYMVVALLIPTGLFYEQTEFRLSSVINKSKRASETEVTTQLGFANFRDPTFAGDRYTPEYRQHEAFLLQHTKLRELPGFDTDAIGEQPDACESMHIRMKRATSAPNRLRKLTLAIDGNSFQRYRRVIITGPGGNGGYLYAQPGGPVSIADLLWGNTKWTGYYRGSPESSPLTLDFDAVLGPDLRCRLTLGS